ncbi:MAG: type II secretion system F family protein [Candidatus Methylomirabilia bacterium]
MPQFAYRAKDEMGKTVTGVMDAPTEDQVDSMLSDRGLYVISVQERAPRATRQPRESVGRISRRELILFTVHLGTILSAGVPLLPALKEYAREASPRVRTVTEILVQKLERGVMLSEAMASLPKVFSEVYVATVRAGEASGKLDAVLMELVASLEWQEGLASQLRQASIYPALLMTALGILATVLFTFVLPKFKGLLAKTGAPMPLPTKIVLAIGDFMAANWMLVFLGIFGLVVAVRLAVRVPAGRLLVDRVKLQVPVVGGLLQKIAMSRFAHFLETLHRAGVEFALTLMVLERVVGNAVIARGVARVRERVVAGMSFTDALRLSGEFPPLVVRMVSTGEMSGNLGDSLAKISQYYDREVPDTVRRLFALIEPAVIAVMAVVVLGSILSVYLPIYSILGKMRYTGR